MYSPDATNVYGARGGSLRRIVSVGVETSTIVLRGTYYSVVETLLQ